MTNLEMMIVEGSHFLHGVPMLRPFAYGCLKWACSFFPDEAVVALVSVLTFELVLNSLPEVRKDEAYVELLAGASVC